MKNNMDLEKKHSTSHIINYSINHINNLLKNKEHVLHINLGKCCYMEFRLFQNIFETKFKIGKNPIKQVSETKFLGTIIDLGSSNTVS